MASNSITETDKAVYLEFDRLRAELEELKQMVREAATLEDLNDLRHYVGPSEDESKQAEERLLMLESISDRCAWDKFESQCSLEEHQARAEWQSIMDRQQSFESKYC